MPPDSSKNRSSTSVSCVGIDAERAASFGEVRDDLLRRAARQTPVSLGEPVDALGAGRPAIVGRAARRHRARRSLTARDSSSLRAGASPSQNGIVGGAPVRVGHADGAAADLQDLPRRVAELKDVAGHALDGEVLVQRADERVVGLEDDAVVGDLGDGAAGGQREQPRAAPAAHASR